MAGIDTETKNVCPHASECNQTGTGTSEVNSIELTFKQKILAILPEIVTYKALYSVSEIASRLGPTSGITPSLKVILSRVLNQLFRDHKIEYGTQNRKSTWNKTDKMMNTKLIISWFEFGSYTPVEEDDGGEDEYLSADWPTRAKKVYRRVK